MKQDMDQLKAQLIAREPIFHHPDKFGSSRDALLEMTCESFWEVGASGTVYTREMVIDLLLKRYSDPHYEDVWKAQDFEIQPLGETTFLLTYVLFQKDRMTRRATIWRLENQTWKIMYHQGTVVEQPL